MLSMHINNTTYITIHVIQLNPILILEREDDRVSQLEIDTTSTL